MATKTTIKGGPQLKARLDNLVSQVPEGLKEQWANDAAERMSRTAPVGRTGRLSRSFEVREHTTKTSGYSLGAAVYGAFWGIFVDRGAKAAKPRYGRGSTTGKGSPALKLYGFGDTVFAKKIRRRRRKPFITRAAQGALAEAPWVNLVQQAWSGRRLTRRGRVSGKRTFLGGG